LLFYASGHFHGINTKFASWLIWGNVLRIFASNVWRELLIYWQKNSWISQICISWVTFESEDKKYNASGGWNQV
jgi:hypothetical protein